MLHGFSTAPKAKKANVPFEIRAKSASCEVAQQLLNLMARKKSNLCVAADVQDASELVALAKKVGPHICLLKTHVDLCQGFTQDIADDLVALAQQHDFIILEDRYAEYLIQIMILVL